MLVPAPYEAPEKKAAGTRKGRQSKVISDSSSENTEAHSSHKNEEEEEESSPPRPGETRKGRPPHLGRPKGLPDYSTTAAYNDGEWLPRDKPLAKS